MSQIRVNIRTKVNTKNIRTEVDHNGRECWVVESKTLPAGVVMNNVKYPAEEIDKSFHTLEGTPAPMGHPIVKGKYVSASHPEAYMFTSGAVNRNVKKDGDRISLEKWIDKAFAERNHPQLVKAINEGKPIHTSTGLVLELVEVNEADHKYIGKNMQFDHDAILLGEQGAATPEQGVGIFVNAAGEETEVIESTLYSDREHAIRQALSAKDDGAWLIDFDDESVYYELAGQKFGVKYNYTNGIAELIDPPYSVKRMTLWQRIANKIKSDPVQVEKQKMDEEIKQALAANAEAMKALSDGLAAVNAVVTQMQTNAEAAAAAEAAKIEAEEAELRKDVAKQLGEDVAEALTGNALRAAHAKLTANPAQAAAADLRAGFTGNTQAGQLTYEKE